VGRDISLALGEGQISECLVNASHVPGSACHTEGR
jgi:hypothetical protein